MSCEKKGMVRSIKNVGSGILNFQIDLQYLNNNGNR